MVCFGEGEDRGYWYLAFPRHPSHDLPFIFSLFSPLTFEVKHYLLFYVLWVLVWRSEAPQHDYKKADVELFFGSSKCEKGVATVPFLNYFKFSDLKSLVVFELI